MHQVVRERLYHGGEGEDVALLQSTEQILDCFCLDIPRLSKPGVFVSRLLRAGDAVHVPNLRYDRSWVFADLTYLYVRCPMLLVFAPVLRRHDFGTHLFKPSIMAFLTAWWLL